MVKQLSPMKNTVKMMDAFKKVLMLILKPLTIECKSSQLNDRCLSTVC
jgi:hypothetical protein